jgi:hypothetical protein
METWLESVNDLLVPHIFKGLQEAYNAVNRLTKGSKLFIAFQVTLEGITSLPQSKISQDYDVLVNNLIRNGHNEEWFTTLLKHLYHSYAKGALEGAGLKLGDNFDPTFIEVPEGSAFVHSVYINTARELWQKPFLFSHKVDNITKQNNVNEITTIIRNSISRAVRDGVNLNRLLTAYKTGTQFKNEIVKEEMPENLREKFKRRINHDIFQSDNNIPNEEPNEEEPNEETYLTEPLDRLSVCETIDDDENNEVEYTISDVSDDEDEPLKLFKVEDIDNVTILQDNTSNYTIQTDRTDITDRTVKTVKTVKTAKPEELLGITDTETVKTEEPDITDTETVKTEEPDITEGLTVKMEEPDITEGLTEKNSDEDSNHSVHTVIPPPEKLKIRIKQKSKSNNIAEEYGDDSELVVHLLDDELTSRLSLLSNKTKSKNSVS